MALSTKTISLSTTPLNLAADAQVAAELASGAATLAIQNLSEGKDVYLADTTAAPAAQDKGMLLRHGDAVIFTIDDAADALWLWTPSLTGAEIGITNAGGT